MGFSLLKDDIVGVHEGQHYMGVANVNIYVRFQDEDSELSEFSDSVGDEDDVERLRRQHSKQHHKKLVCKRNS